MPCLVAHNSLLCCKNGFLFSLIFLTVDMISLSEDGAFCMEEEPEHEPSKEPDNKHFIL